MKICLICPRFPYPENGGDVIRINNIARYLKAQGHSLVLISFSSKTEPENNKELEYLYDNVYIVQQNKILSVLNACLFYILGFPLQCGFFYSGAFLKRFKHLVKTESPDLYVAHTCRVAYYLEKTGIFKNCIIEMTDALSKTYSNVNISRNKSYKQIAYLFEKKRINKFEKRIITKFNKISLVSQSDKEFLGNKNNIYVYPNGITLSHKNIKTEYDKNKVVFIGNMRTLQNQDAVLFFVEDIFPKLKEKHPQLCFYIIGAEPSKKIQNLDNGKDVFVTGYVEDVNACIQDACLMVAPVRIAAGIQNKVLLAMVCQLPVVLSQIISQGIPELVHGKNCFIAANTEEYVEYCSKIIDDCYTRYSIAKSGNEMVQTFYSWNDKLDGYEKL